MPFCYKCGNRVSDKATFCFMCGAKVINPEVEEPSQRKQEWAGKVVKCPSCGENVPSFTSRCSSCGFEFREIKISSAVEEFSKKLQLIEAQRAIINEKRKSGLSTLFGLSDFEKERRVDKQIVNLINSFPIPNTKEDVFEFMILASSNMEDISDTQLSNAWKSKTNQVYKKAELSFGTDSDFKKIQDIYDNRMAAMKKAKKSESILIIGLFLFFIICFGLAYFLVTYENKRIDKLDRELNAKVEEIQADINNKDYDSALIKANGLRFDEDLSSSKAEQWDEQREKLIELINEKKEEEEE